MSSFVRNLIEYQGIDLINKDDCALTTKSFKQATIDVNLCVPEEKPDIEQVVKVVIKKKVVKYKIVKTPKGISPEGQEITGNKLLVMGDIILKINYVADESTQSMHSFHVTVPFCEYVVLPVGFKGLSIVAPDIYIEDVYVNQQDCRSLFGNVTLLTVADLC
ncbi:MAG: SPOCS domain-containing protein [Sarcina sp.]